MGIPGAIKELKSGYCWGSVKAMSPVWNTKYKECKIWAFVLQNCCYWPVKAGFIARDKFSNFPKRKIVFAGGVTSISWQAPFSVKWQPREKRMKFWKESS